ncbi:MAG: Bifunctional protein HldE [Phycisphaerae bacterium]|nr:Bifunctional protein HldE [Phycisphaerae bacterium]
MARKPEQKVITSDRLFALVQELRLAGRTIVQCHGCFDIVHPGHIRYLQFARELGDVLLVSLTGDAEIEKGPGRPLIPEDMRAESLAALEFVDYVVIDASPTACALLNEIRPDVYVKGREYAQSADPRFAQERAIVESYGGRVVFSSGEVVFSSTRLVESLRSNGELEADRLRAFCRRNGIATQSLRQALRAMSKVRVLVVGDLIEERYEFCDASEVAADAPVMSLRRLDSACYWGGAAAVARQAAALGAEVFLITAAGRDETPAVGEALEEIGLAGHLLIERPEMPRRTTYVADDAKLLKVSAGGSAPIDSSAERQAAAALDAQWPRADLLLWSDHGLGMVTPALLAAASAAAGGRRLVAAHTPGQRAALDQLRGAELLLLTERRLREAGNDMSSGLSAVAWNVMHRTASQSLIVWMRKRGLIAFDRRSHDPRSSNWSERLRSEYVGSLAAHALDSLGVEESMLAVAALARAAQRPLEQALYLASAVEALTVGRMGGAGVAAGELNAWLAHRAELQPASRFVASSETDATPRDAAPTIVDAAPADGEAPSRGVVVERSAPAARLSPQPPPPTPGPDAPVTAPGSRFRVSPAE